MATYAEYMKALWADRKLTSTQKLVAVNIAQHADWKTGRNSHPGNDRIAAETALSKRAVINAVTELVNQGWLIKTYSGRGATSTKANEYSLSIPGMMTMTHDQSASDASQSAYGSIQSASEDSSKCSTFTTSTSISTSVTTSSSKAEEKAVKEKTGKKRTKITQEHLGLSPRALEGSSASLGSPAPGPQGSGHSYTYWEKDGSWFVFPAEQVKYKAKGAVTVTLSDEENDFYQTFFRGGKHLNEPRKIFLETSPEQRVEDMAWIANHPEARPGLPD